MSEPLHGFLARDPLDHDTDCGPPKSRRGSETKTGTLSLFVLPHGVASVSLSLFESCLFGSVLLGFLFGLVQGPLLQQIPSCAVGCAKAMGQAFPVASLYSHHKKRSLCKEILEQSCSPLNDKDGDLVWFAFPKSKGQSHL